MPDVIYSYAKLGDAVQTLAVHPGRIKERLTEAANYLPMIDANIFTVPGMTADAASFWQKIWSTLTARHEEKRGSFGPSIDELSEKEASDIAQLIVSLDSMVDHYLEHNK